MLGLRSLWRPRPGTSSRSGDAGRGRLIDLRHVVKTYASTAGTFTALKGVDLQVDHGEFVTVIGKIHGMRKGGATMRLMRLEPFGELEKMRRDVDRLLEDVFVTRPTVTPAPVGMWWEPPVELFETDTEVVVKAALPNIDPKNVDITVTNDTITLKGETKHEEEHKGRNYFTREMQYGAFLRALPLLAEVKSAEAKATYKDGVLEVKVPKTEQAKATSKQVKVES